MRKLPDKWKIIKLSDVANISAGGTPSRNVQEYWKNGNIPWLKISDLKNTYINHAEEKITQNGLDNSSAKIFPKGTIVYSIFATLGAVGILEISAATNQAIAGIIPKNTLIDTKYLYYCLQSEKNNILAKKSHATQDNINLTILRNHEIPLPSLPTQKKIAAILEKAEKLREWRKEAYELTDRFLKSIFFEMFGDPETNPKGWKEGYLGDFFSDIRYGVSIKSGIEGYPIIGMNSITYEGRIDWNNLSKVKLTQDNFQKERLNKHDLLFNRTNAFDLVGKTGIVNRDVDAVAASYLIRLRIDPSYEPYFVWGLMNSPYFKAIFSQRCKKAVNQANINSKELAAFPAIFPPLPLQQKYARVIQQVEAMREYQKQSKQHIENLFNVLMQKAFRGDLV